MSEHEKNRMSQSKPEDKNRLGDEEIGEIQGGWGGCGGDAPPTRSIDDMRRIDEETKRLEEKTKNLPK